MGVKKYFDFLNEEVSEEVLKFRRAMGDYGDENRGDQDDDDYYDDNDDNDDDRVDNWDFFKKEKTFYLYHATEQNLLMPIIRNGLNGKIYLTKSPEEALEKHPVLLRIDAKGLNLEREGEYFITSYITSNRIEVIGTIQNYRNFYTN